VLGLAAVIVVATFWANRLHQPRPAPVQTKAAVAAPVDPAAQTMAAWLGPGQLRLNVAVIGLMRRADRAVAVLAINGAPPKAFMAGETLMRDVTLASIEPDAVTIERAGIATRIAAPARPDYGPPGIVRVP
jgi:general secretion pathway protein C